MLKRAAVSFLALLLFQTLTNAQKRPITVEDMWKMNRVSAPQVSPDGKTVAYVITSYDMEQNKGTSRIYLVPVGGGESSELSNGMKSSSDPVWSPDGKDLAFVADDSTGTSQIYISTATGSNVTELTHIALGTGGLLWSPDGKYIAFTSDVYPDCNSDSCNAVRAKQVEESKVKAKLFTSLPYRVWNYWKDGKRSHLFVVNVDSSTTVDLTPGDYDTPPIDLGGRMDYAFSPDSKEVCFVRNTDRMVAVSTNNDLFTVSVTGGKANRITTNPSNDNQPLYSPDGRYIAYRAQLTAGFESDRSRLMLYDRKDGTIINLTDKYDRSVDEVIWSPDSKNLYFNSDDEGYHNIYRADATSGRVTKITDKFTATDLSITPDGSGLIFLKQTVTHPNDIYGLDLSSRSLTQLTHANDVLLGQLDMNPWEPFWFKGADGTKSKGLLSSRPTSIRTPSTRWCISSTEVRRDNGWTNSTTGGTPSFSLRRDMWLSWLTRAARPVTARNLQTR